MGTAALAARSSATRPARPASGDTSFATVQHRGHQAIGVDQYTSTHGDFSIPGFVHDRPVPGVSVMRARRSVIRYQVIDL